MTFNVDKVQFYSGLDTMKNFPTENGSITVSAQSYNAGQYRKFSTTISLSRILALTQILSVFSTTNTDYHVGGLVVYALDANFQVQLRSSYNGAVMTIDCYVVNQSPGVATNTAFDVAIQIRRFIPPF